MAAGHFPPVDVNPVPEDGTTTFPSVRRITPIDLVAPPAANRAPDNVDDRTESLRAVVNTLVDVVNDLYDFFVDRDGTTPMTGPLGLDGNRIINMDEGRTVEAGDLFTYRQLEVGMIFPLEDVEDVQNASLLRLDGSSAMAGDLDLTITHRLFNILPTNVATISTDLITRSWVTSLVTNITQNYLDVVATQPMVDNLNMRDTDTADRFHVINISNPTQDHHVANKFYLDDELINGFGALDVPRGAILFYGASEAALLGGTNPPPFLPCDGREVSEVFYADLFAQIGNAYGTPSQPGVFKLPDFRGRTVVGFDNMGGTDANRLNPTWASSFGGVGGSQSHVLGLNEMGLHDHAYSDAYYLDDDAAGLLDDAPATQASDGDTLRTSVRLTDPTGDGNAHNNVQPSAACRFYIRY